VKKKIELRKVPVWQFFNDNIDACGGPVKLTGLDALGKDNRQVVDWFIDKLAGCRNVLDLGCGVGHPGLYLAPRLGQITCMDAAPNMVAQARSNALGLHLNNVRFEVGGTARFPFKDRSFDGLCLCGVLESMDWNEVQRVMLEVERVLASSGRVAVLEEDWQDILRRRPREQAHILFRDSRLMYLFVELILSPPGEKDSHFLIDTESRFGEELLAELGDNERTRTSLKPDDLDPDAVLDAWYDEMAHFDAETLKNLFVRLGFRDIRVQSRPTWSQEILYLTAVK